MDHDTLLLSSPSSSLSLLSPSFFAYFSSTDLFFLPPLPAVLQDTFPAKNSSQASSCCLPLVLGMQGWPCTSHQSHGFDLSLVNTTMVAFLGTPCCLLVGSFFFSFQAFGILESSVSSLSPSSSVVVSSGMRHVNQEDYWHPGLFS